METCTTFCFQYNQFNAILYFFFGQNFLWIELGCEAGIVIRTVTRVHHAYHILQLQIITVIWSLLDLKKLLCTHRDLMLHLRQSCKFQLVKVTENISSAWKQTCFPGGVHGFIYFFATLHSEWPKVGKDWWRDSNLQITLKKAPRVQHESGSTRD